MVQKLPVQYIRLYTDGNAALKLLTGNKVIIHTVYLTGAGRTGGGGYRVGKIARGKQVGVYRSLATTCGT